MPGVRTAFGTAIILVPALGACGPQIGALLYHAGLHPKVKVKAKCELTTGPLMILVDDDQELLDSPRTRQYLVSALAREFQIHGINTNVIDNREVDTLRQRDPKFEDRGCREVGRQLAAEQVVWLQIESFRASIKPEDLDQRPEFAVTVKVINALAEKREDVRIWPDATDGHRVIAIETTHAVQQSRSKDELAKKLATNLAHAVANLFRNYEIDQDEAERESRETPR